MANEEISEVRFLTTAFFLIGMAAASAGSARAQEAWPQRQVTVVVPFGAGGSTDMIARILAQHMQENLGQPFVVENRAGAGGSIGAGAVARAPKDGYTLLVGSVSSNAINASLYTKLPFDVGRDFQPVSLIATLPNLLFVHPRVPAKTVGELVTYLKENNGKVNFGSSGNGTSSHLSAVMLQMATGTTMNHVPFRSTGEVMNSIVGGHIDLAIDNMSTAWPQAQAGAVRAIAVTTPERSATAPDLPTIAETLPGFSATAWQGLFAPAGTPRPVVDKLAAEVKRIVTKPEVVKALNDVGAMPQPMTPEEFTAFTEAERAKWADVVKASGVRID